MTINELGNWLEDMVGKGVIRCFVENNKLIAAFTMRKGLEVEVLTPQERRLFSEGEFSQNDMERKLFELKQIGAKNEE